MNGKQKVIMCKNMDVLWGSGLKSMFVIPIFVHVPDLQPAHNKSDNSSEHPKLIPTPRPHFTCTLFPWPYGALQQKRIKCEYFLTMFVFRTYELAKLSMDFHKTSYSGASIKCVDIFQSWLKSDYHNWYFIWKSSTILCVLRA